VNKLEEIDSKQNLETAGKLAKILGQLGKSSVNIAILTVLFETTYGLMFEAMTKKEIIEKIYEKFGKKSFEANHIQYGLDKLCNINTITVINSEFAEDIYVLTEFGQTVGIALKKMTIKI